MDRPRAPDFITNKKSKVGDWRAEVARHFPNLGFPVLHLCFWDVGIPSLYFLTMQPSSLFFYDIFAFAVSASPRGDTPSQQLPPQA